MPQGQQKFTYYSPRERFEKDIQQEVKDNCPELYQNFMALLDKRFSEPNQSHMWFDEDGRLLKMEFDFTYDAYEPTMTLEYDFIKYMLQTDVYDEQLYQTVTVPTDFALLTPVTRTVVFSYDDQVQPVVPPSEYIDLYEE